jgi:hypothetical protein
MLMGLSVGGPGWSQDERIGGAVAEPQGFLSVPSDPPGRPHVRGLSWMAEA